VPDGLNAQENSVVLAASHRSARRKHQEPGPIAQLLPESTNLGRSSIAQRRQPSGFTQDPARSFSQYQENDARPG